tara:strand:+ start:7777 stop:8154 length:378 start_codon:yes stop_codon:yes gene_type:complete
MTEAVNKIIASLGIEKYTILLKEMSYLVFFLIILGLGIFFLLILVVKRNKKTNKINATTKKPVLNELIDKEDIKIQNDNDFVDVLVAIEEEMSAIRELYVGGYISKGVYISETDRLYEKAKIFGL